MIMGCSGACAQVPDGGAHAEELRSLLPRVAGVQVCLGGAKGRHKLTLPKLRGHVGGCQSCGISVFRGTASVAGCVKGLRSSQSDVLQMCGGMGNLLACWKGKPDPRGRRVRGLPKQAEGSKMRPRHAAFTPGPPHGDGANPRVLARRVLRCVWHLVAFVTRSTKPPRLLPVWQEITEGNGPRYAPPEQQYTWPATYLSPHRCWNEELSRGVARSRLRVRLQGLEDEGQEEGEEERAEHTNTGSMHGSWELNAACT